MKGEPSTHADTYQVGGNHYEQMEIQPWEVLEAILTPDEFCGFLKGNIVKYSMRQGKKDSDDANKARHYVVKYEQFRKKMLEM